MHGSGDIRAVWEGDAVVGRKKTNTKGRKQYKRKRKVNRKEKENNKKKKKSKHKRKENRKQKENNKKKRKLVSSAELLTSAIANVVIALYPNTALLLCVI